jgi:hypothetical protein
MQINDLTREQRLGVPCPSCAAALQERCSEISSGAFRQEEHLARLLSAAGQEMPSLLPRTAQGRGVGAISVRGAGISPAD